ncbi:AzlD family protein [Sneathiella sp. P13V-1]|uniref:AzlD family protein n=1 Tax=Sneathiella sp. P13V-1 TaxID=2697366 RepID=UPI00187B6CD4|nr:AzlD domain-containing protein [Sneathiella sp. P13V-1]MBE7638227.1 AzlD family protein [Sneathiella sp. P13V-1]
MNEAVLIIILCAVATYITRIGGHLVLSRFGTLNHRVEAALNAAPIAVLTALVAPYAATKGPAEAIAFSISILISLRFSLLYSVAGGLLVLSLLRLALVG